MASPIPTKTAVLFVMFRRADLVGRCFAAVQSARPACLYLAADGPRPQVAGEDEQCARTRAVVEAMIDWPCDVHRDYATQNLGSGRRVSEAITWAFRTEERLIIIEDDCVADPTFFRFCDELLEYHANDDRVAMISGDQFVPGGWPCAGASYAFVRLAQIWGWATWRRAWRNFDFNMGAWPDEQRRGLLGRIFSARRDRRHWTGNFNHALSIDCWDYQWCFARWRLGQAGIVPDRNLVTNIGFGPGALHTKAANHPVAALPRTPMEFPLKHPQVLAFDNALDEQSARRLFCGGFTAWWNYQRDQRLARWLPALFPPR